jgi:hypothetical protein
MNAVRKRLSQRCFSPRWRFTVLSSLILLAGFANAGCKKENAPAVETNPALEPASPVSVASEIRPGANPPVVLPTVAPRNSNTDESLTQLSTALRRYVLQTKRAPKTFEEFISLTRIQPPPPPTGQKYAIERGAVVLVNQ